MTHKSFGFSIGRKIFIGFFILILVYLGMGIQRYSEMNEINSLADQAVSLNYRITSMQELAISLETLERDIDKYFITNYKENQEEVDKDLENLKSNLKSKEINADNNSIARFQVNEKILSEISMNFDYLANSEQNSTNSREINEKRILIYLLLNSVRQKQSELLVETNNKIQANVVSQKLIISRVIKEYILVGILILLFGVLLSFITSISISRPINKLTVAADEISKGLFNVNIPIQSNDEVGQLASAFNKMTLELQKTTVKRKLAEDKIKSSLEEKEVLLREIHHRVKNNMQIVSSLLLLQSENIEDKKYRDIFIDSQNRIQAMALIHEKLYQSESLAQINFKEYIDSIVSNISESYGQKSNIKLDINIENVPLNINYAVPCGLIINELVTNSFKYAFPDGRQGIIKISAKSNDDGMIQLSISDDGIGIPKDLDIRNTNSLGLRLIIGLAESQLHGEMILNRDSGTEFQINFRGQNDIK